MNIWVDADACPAVIRDILFRAAERTGLKLTLVANKPMHVSSASNIRFQLVPGGFDVADNEIVKQINAGDLVVTSDVPLAAEVIEKGGHALSPHGELYSPETIRARLTMRDFMDTLRASGVHTSGPPAFSHSNRKAFADNLDRLLAKQSKNS
jgi:uncharacterized protein